MTSGDTRPPTSALVSLDDYDLDAARRTAVPIRGLAITPVAAVGRIPVCWLDCRQRPDLHRLLTNVATPPTLNRLAWHQCVRDDPAASVSVLDLAWADGLQCVIVFAWRRYASTLLAGSKGRYFGLTARIGRGRPVLILPCGVPEFDRVWPNPTRHIVESIAACQIPAIT